VRPTSSVLLSQGRWGARADLDGAGLDGAGLDGREVRGIRAVGRLDAGCSFIMVGLVVFFHPLMGKREDGGRRLLFFVAGFFDTGNQNSGEFFSFIKKLL
jgi:hypothetical protein